MSDETSNDQPPDSPEGGVAGLEGVTVLGGQADEASGAERYYIQRKSGKVFGPFEQALIQQMIDGGKLSGNEGVSKDKKVWIPILAVSSFAQLFRDRSDGSAAGGGSGGAARPGGATVPGRPGTGTVDVPPLPSFSDIPMPEPIDFDMSDFSGGMGGKTTPDAEMPGSEGAPGGFERLPSSLSGLVDLPGSTQNQFAGSPDSLPELPRPKSGAGFPSADSLPELPRPKSGAGFPGADSLPELPRPKSGAGFPGADNLPELPRPKGAGSSEPELPRPVGENPNLPVRKIDFGSLPLAGEGNNPQLPARRYGDGADLPGFSMDETPAFDFGTPGEEPSFGSPVQRPSHDDSLPFPNSDFTASGIDLNLDPTGQTGSPFGEAFGDPGAAGGAADAPFGEPSYGDIDLDAPAYEQPDFGDPFDDAQPAEPEPAPAAAKAKPAKSAGQRPAMIKYLAVVGVVALVGMVAVATGLFGGSGGTDTEPDLGGDGPEIVLPPARVVELSLLQPGAYADYDAFLDEAVEASNQNENDQDAVARLVIGQCLMAIQYGDSATGAADVARRAEALGSSNEPLHALARGANQARLGHVDETVALLEPLQLGEFAEWAHLFTGLSEIERYDRALASYNEPAAMIEEAPAEDGASDDGSDPDGASDGDEGEEGAEGDEAGTSTDEDAPEGEAADEGEAPADGAAEDEEAAEVAEEGAGEAGAGEAGEAADDSAVDDELIEELAEPAEPPTLQELAIESLQTASRLNPELIPAQYFLALAERRRGNETEAQSVLTTIVDAHPQHLPSQLDLAELLLVQGQYDDVGRRLTVLLESPSGETTDRERSRLHHLDGRVKSARRLFTEAAEAYRQALLEDSSNTSAMWDFSQIQVRMDNAEEALTFVAENVDRSEDDIEFVLARAVLQVAHLEAATNPDPTVLADSDRVIDAARQNDPTDPRLPYYLGRIRQADGRFDPARELYESAIEIDPGFRQAYLRLADVSRMSNENDAAHEYLSLAAQRGEPDAEIETEIGNGFRILGDYEGAATSYLLAIELEPHSLDARLALADYYTRVGSEELYVEAIEQLQYVEEAGVDEIELHALFADARYHLGDLESARNRMDRIIEDLEEERNAEHLYLVGRIEFDQSGIHDAAVETERAQESYARAQQAFHLAFTRGRGTSDTRYWEARAHLAMADYGNAVPAFRRTLDLAVEEGNVRGEYNYWLGLALEQTRNYPQALDAYRLVDRFDLEWALQNPAIFFHRGRLLANAAQLRAAERDFRWTLILEPDHYEAAASLARVYNQQQDFDGAIALWRRSLGIEEEQPRVHYDLGMLFNRLEQSEESIVHLERSRDLAYGPTAPILHRVLGFLYRDTGRTVEACVELNRYLELERPPRNSPLEVEVSNQMRRIRGCSVTVELE